jgi:pimeloyl-ACP methyl ester carboxylesterase
MNNPSNPSIYSSLTMHFFTFIFLIFIYLQMAAQKVHAQSTSSLSTEDFKWPSQFVRNGPANLRVIVQGSGPTVVILPSLGRDSGDDFNYFSSALVQAGYLVLRPQARGMLGSTGPMENVTMDDLVEDVAQAIDVLGGGKAIVIGHAYGAFVTRVLAAKYPEKVPAVITAAAQAMNVPANISALPAIAANLSAPIPERLAALSVGFFAPNHDPHIWLDGWWPEALVMQTAAVKEFGSLNPYWAGGNTTQVLEILAEYDPFHSKDQWNQSTDLYPDRVVSVVIDDASHALFPEQGEKVVEIVLPWLKAQSSKLG